SRLALLDDASAHGASTHGSLDDRCAPTGDARETTERSERDNPDDSRKSENRPRAGRDPGRNHEEALEDDRRERREKQQGGDRAGTAQPPRDARFRGCRLSGSGRLLRILAAGDASGLGIPRALDRLGQPVARRLLEYAKRLLATNVRLLKCGVLATPKPGGHQVDKPKARGERHHDPAVESRESHGTTVRADLHNARSPRGKTPREVTT